MKFFETPEMNITIFDNSDVVTTSGEVTPAVDAKAAAQTVLETKGIAADNILTITF